MDAKLLLVNSSGVQKCRIRRGARLCIANAFGPIGPMIESPGYIARASCSHFGSLSHYFRLLDAEQSSAVKKRALCNLSICTFSMKCIRLGGWQHCSLDFFVVGVSYRVLSSCLMRARFIFA
jgi:hypothetical protein